MRLQGLPSFLLEMKSSKRLIAKKDGHGAVKEKE